MPHNKSISTLRQELKTLLVEDLAAALTALKELLPETAEKHGQVLALQARLKDANKERIRNTIAPDDYQRRVDTVRAECFDLIDALEESDFEPGKSDAVSSPGGKQGSVLYRVPRRMAVQKPSICTVRVAIDEDAILEDIVLDDDVTVRSRVEVSDMMTAELIDPDGEVFSIRSLSATEQLVRPEGYTQWLFSVTPRSEGEHALLVKVSMLEYNEHLDKYVPREVTILETVTITTEPAEEAETPLKTAGERFALAPAPGSAGGEAGAPPAPSYAAQQESPAPLSPPPPPYIPVVEAPPIENKPARPALRTAALFLAFLLLGTSATWAFTPPPTRDWWKASWQNDAAGYAAYIEKYDGDASNQYLEMAYFRRAQISGALEDLRAYQHKYSNGRFEGAIREKLRTLENEALDYIRREPTAKLVRQYVRDYYDSDRLDQVKAAVETRAELRAELMPLIEEAYVRRVQADPDPQKVTAFLRDFPQSERLGDLTKAAASRPEVLRQVQPAIEQAILEKTRAATLPAQVQNLLPALESLGDSTTVEKMQDIVSKNPQIRRQLLPQLRAAGERLRDSAATGH